jgi:hypothetical protein
MKKYYREYTSACGYGVMIACDTVMANSREEAIQKPMRSRYGRSNVVSLESIITVPEEEYHLTDEELSKKYGA